MLTLDIASLAEGIHEVVLHPDPEALDLDPALFSEIDVYTRIDFNPRRILVTVDPEAVAHLTCDRTLVDFDLPVQGTYTLLFADPDLAPVTGDAFDDILPLHPNDRALDITEPVRDTLLLALPLRRVAPEAEDVELQLHFGTTADDAIDPRWEALRTLRG